MIEKRRAAYTNYYQMPCSLTDVARMDGVGDVDAFIRLHAQGLKCRAALVEFNIRLVAYVTRKYMPKRNNNNYLTYEVCAWHFSAWRFSALHIMLDITVDLARAETE